MKGDALYTPKRNVAGLLVKYLILGVISAMGAYAVYLMLLGGLYWQAALLAIAVLGINWLYLTERAVPLKYLLPGTVTMVVFAVLPIAYTVFIAFTNYSTGHAMSKEEAVAAISSEGYTNFDSYSLQVATDPNGQRVLLLQRFDANTGEDKGSYIATATELAPAPVPFEINQVSGSYEPIPPKGYKAVDANTVNDWIQSGKAYKVPLPDGHYLQLDTANVAYDRAVRWTYDKAKDTFTDNTCGSVYRDNGSGSYGGKSCATKKYELLPKGWRVGIGLENFSKIFTNPRYSEPMGRVFIWTVVYALSTVFLTFTVGLLVAFLFNVPKMRGRKIYRSFLIVPYAIPGFLSILVWRGLLNDQWGAVNSILHLSIPWLTDPNWAKVSILLCNLWLGFPYMFLVATGALQAIPSELKEAASVDGANRFQVFRNVTLPLLLVAVGPLLVGSFSYNFNNFNQVYLLTGGGPDLQNVNSAAGATDILISYTYKLAFQTGAGNNYGLASAVSILLFFIVASISFWSFSRSKALENMA